MKIKRYLVREMQEAIRLIKEDLGPEAVIVSSYRVPAKGFWGLFAPRLLEVTAAVDDRPQVKLDVECPPAQLAVDAARPPAGMLAPGRAGDRAEGRWPAAPARELRTGSWRLEAPVRASFAAQKSGPVDWRRLLLDMEIQECLVDRLLAALDNGNPAGGRGLSREGYTGLYREVVRLLDPLYRPRPGARVLAFIGPPGAGKTTTLAKLATRSVLYEQKRVGLVAVSSYRIGAYDQLKAYGDFLGVPVDVVMTPAELSQVLEHNADKDCVYVDTDGRPARNAGAVLELKGFLDAVGEPCDVFLVLNSATKNKDLMNIARGFQRIGYNGLVFTRLDETDTYGSILNLMCAFGTPAAYLSDGQEVPDDIDEASPKKIARLLLKGVDPDEAMAP